MKWERLTNGQYIYANSTNVEGQIIPLRDNDEGRVVCWQMYRKRKCIGTYPTLKQAKKAYK